jgi:hypothetical protein
MPVAARHSIFPLYKPSAVDIVVFWEMPSQERSGHVLITDITLGAGHAALRGIVREAESLQGRSMYVETRREKLKLLEAIRTSEWNVEMDPMVVSLQDGFTVRHDFSRGSVLYRSDF